MSQTVTTPPATPLSKEAAYNVIYQKAYVEAWRHKAAQYGIVPQTAEELQQCLETSAALRMRYEDNRVKQAAAGNPAMQLLRKELGFPAAQEAQSIKAAEARKQNDDAEIKRSAAALSFHPDVAHAAMSLLFAPA